MLKQVEQLKILPFILKAYINTTEKNERENIEDVILSILANMAFEETLREQIILFKKLDGVLDKIHKKKRDVLRLLANLTLSKNFDVGIILDSHIEQAFEALRDPEYVIDKETKEKTVSLTCISCLCVILNLTSKGIQINNKFLGLGLTRHLCNMIQNNVSDQKVVPLSFMILSNLLTYDALADRVFNDTIDMLKLIHEMTFLKLKKDTKYNPEDKIFNKIFFLLSYTRFNLNCMLQGLMDKIRPKIVGFERYFEVFLEIFLNVDLTQNNLILLSGRIIYYMILHSEKLYDFLMKKDTFFKRLIQIIAADEYELVMKGKLDVFSTGVTKEKVGPLIANYVTRTTTNYDLLSANDPRSGDVSKSDEEQFNERSPSPHEPPHVLLNDKEKATSQSRMIAFLLLRLISKKEKNSKIFFIYRGLDHLIKYIYKLFQTEKKITEEERESIILFYANIIPSKQIQEKLQKILKFIITNFQKTFNPASPDSILLACMQFFLNLSKNSNQHVNIAKTTFLMNLATVYRRKKPNQTLNLLIQILLSNLSFTFKTHQIIIKSGAHRIVEQLDEKNEAVRQYINISKLNMALNYRTFMLLQNSQSPLISLPLMDHINPVGQIRLYLSALQYLIRDGPFFLSVENVPQDLFHDFSDPNKEQINLFNLLSNTQTEAEKKQPVIHVLKTCFKNLIESLANNQSVYIIKRVVWVVLVLLDHPYLKDVPIDTPRLLIVVSFHQCVTSIAYSFPDTKTRIQAHQIITKIQELDFFFADPTDYSELMTSWFSKCTKVLEYVHKIEEENCRTYIFEYFFKFISFRYFREVKNSSITGWIVKSKFDQFIYLMFERHKFLNQNLFDHMSEALANLFLVPEILQKFDYFRLLNHFEALYANLARVKPQSIIYLVGILYSVLENMSYNFETAIDSQAEHSKQAPLIVTDLNQDTQHNRMFVLPATSKKKEPNMPGAEEVAALQDQRRLLLDQSPGLSPSKSSPRSADNWRDAIRSQRVKESVIQVSISPSPGIEPQISTSASSVTLEQFSVAQEKFLQNMQQSNSERSLVKFSLRVLRYCLRKINYKGLIGASNNDFDFKSRSKEKEYFRYLHLIVDLSAQKINHFVLFHPMFLRDMLYFMMHTDSEHTLHYHRCCDCSLGLTSPHQHDAQRLLPRVLQHRPNRQNHGTPAQKKKRPLRPLRAHHLPALRTLRSRSSSTSNATCSRPSSTRSSTK